MATKPIAPLAATPDIWQILWRRLRRDPIVFTGLMVLLVLYGVVAFADFLAPYSPRRFSGLSPIPVS
jgi:ABC-type antimicrobial peptide transport system permease subunit